MKPTLAAGLTFQRSFTVDADRCIGFMGDEGRVYATPMMLRDIEHTCRDFLLEHIDEGEDSVGTRVELDHLAATPMGFAVTVKGTIVEVKGRAVTFDIEVHDNVEQVARTRHGRFVVDRAKAAERIAAKKRKAGL